MTTNFAKRTIALARNICGGFGLFSFLQDVDFLRRTVVSLFNEHHGYFRIGANYFLAAMDFYRDLILSASKFAGISLPGIFIDLCLSLLLASAASRLLFRVDRNIDWSVFDSERKELIYGFFNMKAEASGFPSRLFRRVVFSENLFGALIIPVYFFIFRFYSQISDSKEEALALLTLMSPLMLKKANSVISGTLILTTLLSLIWIDMLLRTYWPI